MEQYSFFQYLPTDLTNIIVFFVRDYSDLESLIVSFPDFKSLKWPLIHFYTFGGEYVPNMTYEEHSRKIGIRSLREKLNLNMTMVELINFKYLDLSCKELTDVPEEIGNLQNLKYLDLYNNKLPSVPKEIGNLQNLQYLYLSNNQLRNVPKEIGDLRNLQNLSLSNNQLTNIPKEIANLTNLKYLDLKNNKLTDVPKEVKNIRGLSLKL